MKKFALLLTISALLGVKLHAQTQLQQFVKRVNVLDRPNVSYDYKVHLLNTHTNKIEDSIIGRIYKREYEYFDSSGSAIAMVQGNYYCKLDHQRKEALVYDIEFIQRKLNLKIDRQSANALVIPDSIIFRYANLTTDTSREYHIYKWTLKNGPASACTAIIERGTLKLTRLSLETVETGDDGEPAYKRICTIYNIRNEFPLSAINMRRFCEVNGNKVTLTSKYAGYNLKKLIN